MLAGRIHLISLVPTELQRLELYQPQREKAERRRDVFFDLEKAFYFSPKSPGISWNSSDQYVDLGWLNI